MSCWDTGKAKFTSQSPNTLDELRKNIRSATDTTVVTLFPKAYMNMIPNAQECTDSKDPISNFLCKNLHLYQ